MSRRIAAFFTGRHILALKPPFRSLHEHHSHHRSSVPFAISGIMCAGVLMHTSAPSSSRCLMEAASPPISRPKRRRPPIFGSSIPKITTRGLTTSNGSDTTIPDDIADREDCPLCKKFSKGPCGETFKQWMACTDKHTGKDSSGEPLHLSKCSDFAEKLAECLDANTEYYAENNDNGTTNKDQDTKHETEKYRELKASWTEFVNEMEDGIASAKYNVLPFPDKINPKMEVRLATHTGASFFMAEKDGQPIIAAYILDDGNVIAAGSREDMDMGELGCVLQFKVADGMKSATARAIYDTESGDIEIFSRTMLLPK